MCVLACSPSKGCVTEGAEEKEGEREGEAGGAGDENMADPIRTGPRSGFQQLVALIQTRYSNPLHDPGALPPSLALPSASFGTA